jgi:hypothetical protein
MSSSGSLAHLEHFQYPSIGEAKVSRESAKAAAER